SDGAGLGVDGDQRAIRLGPLGQAPAVGSRDDANQIAHVQYIGSGARWWTASVTVQLAPCPTEAIPGDPGAGAVGKGDLRLALLDGGDRRRDQKPARRDFRQSRAKRFRILN